jgi:hypothetical protein
MDDIKRYAIDIEKIATGAGKPEERGSAVDIKVDECLHDLDLAGDQIQIKGVPATRESYLTALASRLVKLRPVVNEHARPLLERAVARLRQGGIE